MKGGEIVEKLLAMINCADNRKIAIHVAVTFMITALGYNSMSADSLTTWSGLIAILTGVISNPYLLGLCVWNAYSAMSNNSKEEVEE